MVHNLSSDAGQTYGVRVSYPHGDHLICFEEGKLEADGFHPEDLVEPKTKTWHRQAGIGMLSWENYMDYFRGGPILYKNVPHGFPRHHLQLVRAAKIYDPTEVGVAQPRPKLDELKILQKRVADQRKEIARLHELRLAASEKIEAQAKFLKAREEQEVSNLQLAGARYQRLEAYVSWLKEQERIDNKVLKQKLEESEKERKNLVTKLHEAKQQAVEAQAKAEKKDPRDKLLGLDVKHRVSGATGVVVGKGPCDDIRVSTYKRRDLFEFFSKDHYKDYWSVYETHVVESRQGLTLALLSVLFVVAMVAVGFLGTTFLMAPLETPSSAVCLDLGADAPSGK